MLSLVVILSLFTSCKKNPFNVSLKGAKIKTSNIIPSYVTLTKTQTTEVIKVDRSALSSGETISLTNISGYSFNLAVNDPSASYPATVSLNFTLGDNVYQKSEYNLESGSSFIFNNIAYNNVDLQASKLVVYDISSNGGKTTIFFKLNAFVNVSGTNYPVVGDIVLEQ